MREKFYKIYDQLEEREIELKESLVGIEEKIENKTATKEEMKDYKKDCNELKALTKKLDQLENIINVGNDLEASIEKEEIELYALLDEEEIIQNRIEYFESIKTEIPERIAKLDEELTELTDKKAELGKKLKAAKTDEEKESIENEIAENKELLSKNASAFAKVKENQIKYSEENFDEKIIILNKHKAKLGEQIDKKVQTIDDYKAKIARCHLAFASIIKNKNWDEITLEMKNFKDKKYVSKAHYIQKRKEMIEEEIKKNKANNYKTPSASAIVKATEDGEKTAEKAEKVVKIEKTVKEKEPEVTVATSAEASESEPIVPAVAKKENWFKRMFNKIGEKLFGKKSITPKIKTIEEIEEEARKAEEKRKAEEEAKRAEEVRKAKEARIQAEQEKRAKNEEIVYDNLKKSSRNDFVNGLRTVAEENDIEKVANDIVNRKKEKLINAKVKSEMTRLKKEDSTKGELKYKSTETGYAAIDEEYYEKKAREVYGNNSKSER